MVSQQSGRRLRLVYFGTPEFAVPTLRRLIESSVDGRHEVVAVISQPDRPKGRGHHLAPTPTKELALASGIRVLQPERLRDESFLAEISSLSPDLGVVAAYGRLLPDQLLSIPPLGMVNVHASLLPRWRGAAPVHRAVIAGDRETGITIMRVVKELDAGASFKMARRAIDADETSVDVEHALAEMGAGLLLDVLQQIAEGRAIETPARQHTRYLRGQDHQGRRRHRLVVGGRADPQPGARSAALAARLCAYRRRACAHPSHGADVCGEPRRTRHDRPRRTRALRGGRGRRPRPSHPRHPTGRPSSHVGARVSRRPAHRTGHESRAGMIAPAREAAYDALRAVSTESADLPHALARARTRLPDERDRALMSEIVTGTLQVAGRVRSHRRRVQRPAADAVRSGSPRHPAQCHLPAPASRSRAGSGGRQRCRQHDAEGRQEERRPVGQRALASRQPRARSPAASESSSRRQRPRRRARLSGCHAVAPAVAGQPLAGSLRLCSDRSVAAVQQPPGAADDPHEQAADRGCIACRVSGRARRGGRARAFRARRMGGHEREIRY